MEQEETLGVGGAGYTKDASGLSRRQQGKGEKRGEKKNQATATVGSAHTL